MEIYFLTALIVLICSKFGSKKSVGIAALILFILGAFRGYTVGTDTNNTLMIYEGVYGYVEKEGEFLSSFIHSFIVQNNWGIRWELIITQLIFFSSLVFFWYTYEKKSSPYMFFFMFMLGYVFLSYNITRQMMAVSIGIWAYHNRETNGSIKWFILIILVATAFHASAIFLLLLYFIQKYRFSQVFVTVALLVSFMIPLVLPTDSIIDSITGNIPLLNRFSIYVGDENKSVFSLNRLLLNFMYIYILLKYNRYENDLFFKAVILSLLIMNLFPTSSIISRVAIYFSFVQSVLLGRIIKTSDEIDKAVVLVFSLTVFTVFLITNNGGVVPYSFGGF